MRHDDLLQVEKDGNETKEYEGFTDKGGRGIHYQHRDDAGEI